MAAAPSNGPLGVPPATAPPPYLNRYQEIKNLARGTYGRVCLAQDLRTGQLAALKFIESGQFGSVSKYIEREVSNHMRLQHPHIIRLEEVFRHDSFLVLVMEYAAGGDLYSYVTSRQRLSEEEARWFFQQLVVAVDYCHRMGVASRDIKLENTLLDGSPRQLIKLADFGFSKDTNMQSAPTTRLGTPAYLAPEVITSPPGATYDGSKADLWSCGVCLFMMITGMYPFRRAKDRDLKQEERTSAMLQRVIKADYVYPPGLQLSAEVKDLIARILVVDPRRRPTISDLQHHPWFDGGLLGSALRFNDSIVTESLSHPPSPAKLEAIRALVRSGFQLQHPGHQQRPSAATVGRGPVAGGAAAGGPAAHRPIGDISLGVSELLLADEVLNASDLLG